MIALEENSADPGRGESSEIAHHVIDPATVPAYLPPISMQVFQAGGMFRSFRLAKPIQIRPRTDSRCASKPAGTRTRPAFLSRR